MQQASCKTSQSWSRRKAFRLAPLLSARRTRPAVRSTPWSSVVVLSIETESVSGKCKVPVASFLKGDWNCRVSGIHMARVQGFRRDKL